MADILIRNWDAPLQWDEQVLKEPVINWDLPERGGVVKVAKLPFCPRYAPNGFLKTL